MWLRALVGVAAVLAVALVVVLLPLARDPRGARRRFEALFRRPERTLPQPPADHYYRPYWS